MNLFNLPRKAAIAVGIFVVLFLIGIAARCHADPMIRVSGGSTYIRGPAPVLDLGFSWYAGQSTRDFWKADLTLIGQSHWHDREAPNNFALRGLYVTGFGHFDIGLGLAWMQNPQPYNGSPVNFSLELAYRIGRFAITVSHLSNAGTRMPNYGRDFLMIGYLLKP